MNSVDLKSNKKIGLFLPHSAEPVFAIYAIALYKLLRHNEKLVTFFSDESTKTLDNINQQLPNAQILDAISPKQLVLELPTEQEVENVQWEQVGDQLKVYIDNINQTDSRNVRFVNKGTQMDLAIRFGDEEIDHYSKVWTEAQEFLDQENINTLEISAREHTSLAGHIISLAEDMQLNREIAEWLLAGLLEETNDLSTKVDSSKVGKTIAFLTEKAARFEEVAKLRQSMR